MDDEAETRTVQPDRLDAVLDQHRIWLETGGIKGEKAILQGLNLDRIFLPGICLDRADLKDVSLRQADLRDASFCEAHLSGMSFSQAHLRNADFTDVRGLAADQLAGADLSGAKLPDEIGRFEELQHVEHTSKTSMRLLLGVALGCAYAGLTVIITKDASLVVDSLTTPLPIIGTKVSIGAFYLTAPFVLLAAYIQLHLHLERHWEGLASLPAVFADGVPLDQRAYPSLLNEFGADMLSGRKRSLLTIAESLVAILLAWLLVPITITALWLRYLPRHDWAGSRLHVALIGIAVFLGVWFWRLFAGTMRRHRHSTPLISALLYGFIAAAMALGISYGAIRGISHIAVSSTTEESQGLSAVTLSDRFLIWLRIAVPDFLLALPFDLRPYAQLDEQMISPINDDPEARNSAGEFVNSGELRDGGNARCQTEGPVSVGRPLSRALLSHLDLRGASAKGAFLQGASLRNTDFRHANLLAARLDGADLQGALLDDTYMLKARLRLANLNGTGLSHAYLSDATLKNASLRYARLPGAMLVGSDLTCADLLGADLEGAILSGANLWQSTLIGAQLRKAVLYDVDLRTVKGLEQAQLDAACVNDKTMLPQNLHAPAINPCEQTVVDPSLPMCDRAPPCKIVLKSDEATLAAAVGDAGSPELDTIRILESETPDTNGLFFSRVLRWTPETGQVAKRESSLGAAGRPKVRHDQYSEETQS